MESSTLDLIDERIVHSLVVEPRAPFRAIAEVAGVSPQTAARRYRRLQEIASLRVLGRVAAPRVGWVNWYLRLRCVPGAATAVATALARRDDTSWVVLASGGTEVICGLQARSPAQRDELLLDGLPATRRVTSLTAHSLLHNYSQPAWPRLTQQLTETDCDKLRQALSQTPGHLPAPLDTNDERLLDALGRDGRATNASLADTLGWHESTIRHRVAELRRAGILTFDIDIDPVAFGMDAHVMLWASVDPTQLDTVGAAMSEHTEVPFVSATTGPTNLMAALACTDTDHLHAYLTQQLPALPGVGTIETTPLIRLIKGSSHSPVIRH
jgi:DNA-binding Lrp family transcriptional regulator